MAQASVTEAFSCSAEQFFALASDYEKYPEFLQEVASCKIVKDEGQKKMVEYKVSVVKTFTYKLWMIETAPKKIVWEFAGGNLFKTLNGFWEIKPEGEKSCTATYTVDATFGLFVPGPIAKATVSVNLPNMISSYRKRVQTLYGGT